MRLELDRPTFKRLVQFYLLTFLAVVAVMVWEACSPDQLAFSEAFEGLVEAHFGTPSEEWETAALVLGLIATV